MRAREIMTPDPACCTPDDTAADVARVMRDRDCGCVPIIDPSSSRLVGVVTDRDLALRALALGKSGSTPVGELMTAAPRCCHAGDDLSAVERTMADNQVRRVPVVDREGCCIGMISQADLARAVKDDQHVTEHEIAIVIERISEQNRRTADAPGERVFLRGH